MSHEEEKIIIDSRVIAAANRGIVAVRRGALTAQQTRALIKCDRDYLDHVREIAPDLVPEW